MNIRKWLIPIICFLLVTCSFAQKSEIVGFHLEKIEDVGRWDSIMLDKLRQPAYSHVLLTHLSVDSFEHIIMNDQLQIVDVRTEVEYNEGHVPGAIWIDIKSENFIEKADMLLKTDKRVAVYCRRGVRSRRAAEKLLFRGFHVYNLDAGFDQWKKDGKKVEK